MKKIFLFLFIIIFIRNLAAQSDSLAFILNDLNENDTYIDELLESLREHPVYLNDADQNDILRLPFVTKEMADSIIALRIQKGSFKTKRAVKPVLGKELYNLLKDLITISKDKERSFNYTQRNTLKVESIPEIESGIYEGNALYSYSRIYYKLNRDIFLGFVSQKDPGERSYTDHFNFAAEYTKSNWQIILGNYYLHFGHGLVQSKPYGNQKSIYLPAVFKTQSSFARTNLTSSESSGKMGIFLHNRFHNNWQTFVYFSRKSLDVQLSGGTITGFTFDGYHRTDSELESKNRLYETNWGSAISFSSQNIFVGALFSSYRFNPFISNDIASIGDDQKRRQYFAYSGNRLNHISFTYGFNFENLQLSGELSSTLKDNYALSHSIYYSLESVKLGLFYWHFDNNFHSIDGRSFDNFNPFPSGLDGFYSSIQLKAADWLTLSAFKKYEKELWRSYFDPMPKEKDEWLLQIDSKLNKTLLTLRLRRKKNDDFLMFDNQLRRIVNQQRNIRTELTYFLAKDIRIKTRGEFSYLENSDDQGTLFFQDVDYKINSNFSLNSRFTVFKTQSFATRIYEYEKDLPGSFSNFALFDNGHKIYMLTRWNPGSNISIWLKWRYLIKFGQSSSGAPKKSLNRDLRIQTSISF